MSQIKTEVGLGGGQPTNSQRGNNPYSRQSHPYENGGTIAPGMGNFAPGIEHIDATNNASSEPVVGFLYSISRQGIGEYWPLHIGRNTIGRSPECDICLRERTVSDLHAALNIKQMKTTHKVLASLKDEGSKNGIFVNEEELTYDTHACANHDIITIGLHYKLLLILIDAEQMGLSVSEEFIEAESESSTRPMGPEFPRFDAQQTGVNPYDHKYRSSSNETMAMDGSYRTNPGKTEIM